MRHALWRTTIVNEGDKEKARFVARDWPYACDRCPDDDDTRRRYGCGWDPSTQGRGTVVNVCGEVVSTCPQWLAVQPLVVSVFVLLGDYSEGRLGDVRDLPADLLVYLRAAASEVEAWKGKTQERLTDGD